MGGKFFCPVPACQDATDSFDTPWSLRRHFRDRHPRDFVDVEGHGNLPKCQLCNMQADPEKAARHERSKFCREGRERVVQTNAAIANQRALEVGFTAYGEDLERVEVFKYLGQLMSMDDTDTQKVWKMTHRLLRGENMNPRVCGMFFKAIVQAVLLYGSETWVLTDSAMRCLEGFYYRATCRMARENRPKKNRQTGEWTYPARKDVFEEVGLYTLTEYIDRRRKTIGDYISTDRSIFDLCRCRNGERRRGTSSRRWWWDQPINADLESEEVASSVVSEDASEVGSQSSLEDSA
eukprot:scaffold12160_cov75-Skeletonema_marinoi.AAC.6